MQYQYDDNTKEVVQIKQTINWIINSTLSFCSRSDFIASINIQVMFIKGSNNNSMTPKPGVHGPEGEIWSATHETLKYKI